MKKLGSYCLVWFILTNAMVFTAQQFYPDKKDTDTIVFFMFAIICGLFTLFASLLISAREDE